MRFIRGSSQTATRVFLRRLRFRFWDFFVRIWLEKAFSRLSRPEPVTLKRFFAPLLDFIFGITSSPLGAMLLNGVHPQKSRHYTHAASNTFPPFVKKRPIVWIFEPKVTGRNPVGRPVILQQVSKDAFAFRSALREPHF